MPQESGREAQEPRTNGDATGQKSRFGVSQVGLGAASIVLGLYAVWNMAPMLPVVGPMVRKFTEPTNLLEKTADIGKSKKADFAKFVDAGGLDTFQSWHGLAVSNINTAYSDDGNLSRLTLLIGGTAKWSPSISKWTMDSTSAPPALVRSVLAKFCGSDNWQITGVGGRASKTLSNGELICTYNKWNDRSNDLVATLELSAAQAVSPPVAVSVPSTNTAPKGPETTPTQPGSGGAGSTASLVGAWICNDGEQRPTLFLDDGTFIQYSAQDQGNQIFLSGSYTVRSTELVMALGIGRVLRQSDGKELLPWTLSRHGGTISNSNFKVFTYRINSAENGILARTRLRTSTGPGGEIQEVNKEANCTAPGGKSDAFVELEEQRNSVPPVLYSNLQSVLTQ
jgi:hypothetical protein